MSVYDIDGNIISTDGSQVSMKRNNPSLVEQFLNVGRTYLNQDSIEYKDGDTIFYKSTPTNGIDCSTFVGLCIMGLNFTDTPYYTHHYTDPDNLTNNPLYNWSMPVIKYDVKRYIDGYDDTAYAKAKTGGRIARWLNDRGWLISLNNGFRDVEAGDIVCYGRKRSGTDEWVNPTTYLHMNHIAICVSKEPAPDTYTDRNGNTQTWDKEKYPFKHRIIEATATTPPCIDTYFMEQGMEDPNNVWVNNCNTVVAAFRFDLGSLEDVLLNT